MAKNPNPKCPQCGSKKDVDPDYHECPHCCCGDLYYCCKCGIQFDKNGEEL